MSHRTTLVLDDQVREAARELAQRYGCSTSLAIRRAVLRHRDATLGIPADRRQRRVDVLNRLFDLFEGHDAEEEIARLKDQDGGF